MAKKRRVDALLVERGLAPDLGKARALIMAGQVVAGENRVDKAGAQVGPDTPLRIKGRKAHAFVGRGALKLVRGLDHFQIEPQGRRCLDLGASTGGFTDCLLRRGAARVYAVDVGYGLLDWSLRSDDRVVVLERTHAAALDDDRVPEPIDLLVADISFNSLLRILPPVLPLLAPSAQLLVLVKPQFELPPAAVGAGGVVRDPEARQRACEQIAQGMRAWGLDVLGWTPSGTPGAEGNVEFLLAAEMAAGRTL